MTDLERFREVRGNPLIWFQGFGRFLDETSRQPKVGVANILQRRIFEHYRRCQDAQKPCRICVLKYRRAGSSTASSALIYIHAANYNARLGVVGTDYRASQNMLTMIQTFGEHDDFPGWSDRPKVAEQATIPADQWEDRIEKIIATKIEWAHGSTAELYTASNPESARSAGLSGYHATEVGRWQSGGQLDSGETLTSMRNALPKTGFHIAIEESTANGAQGSFHDTCRNARWPEYADWPELHKSCWPLVESEYGRDLQFVFIFAAWFEDGRHVERLTPEQAGRVEATLDAEPWYFGEKELVAKYAMDGPKGRRLGSEVDATIWEQLAWRRGIIKNVCTRRGLDEFAQEYPSNPLEAFRASGAPVFDSEGVTALDEALRIAKKPECGVIDRQPAGTVSFRRTSEAEALIQIWEHPIPGAKFLVVVDPTKTAEIVKGTGERDRNSVLVLRDGFRSSTGVYYPAKIVARVKPPNQWEDAPLARLTAQLATIYGRCIIVVESNLGPGLITRLRDEHRMNLYCQENWDVVRQKSSTQYGWATNDETRRQAVSTLQEYIREQRIEILCPNVIAELKTFVFNTRGRAEAASGAHDDDPMALAIGLCCLPHATQMPVGRMIETRAPDERQWRGVDELEY